MKENIFKKFNSADYISNYLYIIKQNIYNLKN